MENKYYIPEPEEFFMGFQFQYLSHAGEWLNHTFGESSFNNTESDQYDDYLMKWAHAMTRVKCLNREDIESLGWRCREPYIWQFFVGNHDRYQLITPIYTKNENFSSDEPIIIKDTVENWYLFMGLIKNKSELVKLMKQLGIYDRTSTKD